MPKPHFFPQESADFAAALEQLQGHKVVVLGHVRPDGDCIGSQVALTRILRARGIDAIAVNAHSIPRNLRGFVGDTPFHLPSAEFLAGRTAVSVDCAAHARLGKDVVPHAPDVLLNVDHHISNERFGRINLVIEDASATAEVLAGFFFDNDLPVDRVTAQALYVGIATDTGQFRFQSTTGRVFEVCCSLITRGAEPAQAAHALYENEPFAKIELLQRFLASLRFECGGRVCIGLLAQDAWEATHAAPEFSEGLVDYARAIEGVEIGVLLEERNGMVKGSLRSKDPVHRVDRLAALFNGGGHACAAGFNPGAGIAELYPRLVEALENHFAQLQTT